MSKQIQLKTSQNRESKRAEFSKSAKKKSGLRSVVIIALVAIVALGAYLAIGGSGDKPASSTVTSTSQNYSGAASDIRIPVSDIESGRAKFFDYTTSDRRSIRFFALKSSDGVYRAALDACDTCFHAKKGYHQEGDDMVCNNCSLRFPSAKINDVAGGCNPVGLPRSIEGDSLVIKATDLESGKFYF